MSSFPFYLFACLSLGGALAVVLNKNAVNAAMCLLASLTGVAGLFVLLQAGLLAFVLLLVYAGAVVALFLFIIMLLDTTPGSFRPFSRLSIAASVIGAALLALGVCSLHRRAVLPAPVAGPVPPLRHYAEQLFTTYLLPVQVVGFMLLIAMLGVIVLSRKYEAGEGSQEAGVGRPEAGGVQ
jgi:NADH-quinone oxidoreductase subunit J